MQNYQNEEVAELFHQDKPIDNQLIFVTDPVVKNLHMDMAYIT